MLAEAPNLGVGVHLALCGGRPVAAADSVRSLLAPDGAFWPRGQDFIAAWVKGRILPAEVERELDAQVARVRDAGIAVDHLDTHHHLGFLPVVGRAVEAVARRHGIAGHPQRGRAPDAGLGDRSAARPRGRHADRAGLADPPAARRAPARPAELGLRRSRATSTRSGSWRSSGASGPGPARAHLPSRARRPARETRRPVRRATSARPSWRRSPRPRSGARSSSATSASAAGATCFEPAPRPRPRPPTPDDAPPAPYVAGRGEPGGAVRAGDRARDGVRGDLRRRHGLPGAQGRADRLGLDPRSRCWRSPSSSASARRRSSRTTSSRPSARPASRSRPAWSSRCPAFSS